MTQVVDKKAIEAAAIARVKAVQGLRNYTWSMAFIVGNEVLVVDEVHLGRRYVRTGSGGGWEFPVEFQCRWLKAETLIV